jgi:hypothetical protein
MAANSEAEGAMAFLTSTAIGLHVISANENGDGVNANTFDNDSLNTFSVNLRM